MSTNEGAGTGLATTATEGANLAKIFPFPFDPNQL